MKKQFMSFRWLVATLLVALVILVCIRLGIWQLDRLAQRREFNAHYQLMQSSPAIILPASEYGNLTELEYRRIKASGKYDFSQQVAVRNQYHRGQLGYRLLTPLVFSDGTAMLVDRGWIPADGNETPSSWSRYDETGMMVVEGIVRLSREKADITGRSDPVFAVGQKRLDIWNFPNIPRIQNQTTYRLLPVYLQIDSTPGAEEPPIPSQSLPEITEGPHLGYALQWFTFAGIILVGYPLYVKKQISSLEHVEAQL